MAKVIKIAAQVFIGLIEWMVIILLFFAFSIRFSPFQSFLAHKATGFLSKKLNKEIRIDRVDIVFYDRIYLDGVFIEDSRGDTLASIETLQVDLGELDYSFRSIDVKKVALKNGTVKLMKYAGEETFNFQYLVDFFKSDKQREKSATTVVMNLGDLMLKNINFIYDVADKPRIERGMDYAHLDLTDINLHLTNFSNPNGHLVAEIKHLSAIESCGFVLKDFSGFADVSADSLHVRELKIITQKTNAELPYFTLRTGSYKNFTHFVDSVEFNSRIENSVVSMQDIVYFAPALWGMNQEVFLTATVTKRVKDLTIDQLHLETGRETILKGTVKLPDFRSLDYEIVDERLDFLQTSTYDLKNFRLPDKNGNKRYVPMSDELESLGLVQVDDARLFGAMQDFTISLKEARAAVGTIQIPYGVQFTFNEQEDLYYFNRSAYSEYDVRIVSFDLGKFIKRKEFGRLEGDFFLTGKGLSSETFELLDVHGKIRRFEFLDYSYKNVSVLNGTLKNSKFDGEVVVKDENLALNYKGSVEFGKAKQHMDFVVTVSKAELDNLKLTDRDSSSFTAILYVDVIGFGLDDFVGEIALKEIYYKQGTKSFNVEDFVIKTKRDKDSDTLRINSSVVDALVIGKLNFTDFFQSFKNQFATILPSFLNLRPEQIKPIHEDFGYEITIKNAVPIFDVLVPGFSLSSNTTISGKYNGYENYFDLNVLSDKIRYKEMEMNDVSLVHDVKQGKIFAEYNISSYKYNDSLSFDNIIFQTAGTNNTLASFLEWGKVEEEKAGAISWTTTLASPEDYIVTIDNGYFYLKDQRWKFEDTARIQYALYNIVVDDFTLEHNLQYISLGGCISDNADDKLDFFINDFQLADINALFGGKISLEGVLNGRGYFNDAFNTLGVYGDVGIDDLVIDNNELGDINLKSNYNSSLKRFDLEGRLFYQGAESIGFEGFYFAQKESDNIEARLVFDKTNIAFLNAFFDPKVVDNIRGELSGKLTLGGSVAEPQLEGRVTLAKSGAKIGLLGTDYTIEGNIIADEYGFLLPAVPITDEEGNTGSLTGSVFHENFSEWNFDIAIDLETDGIKRDPYHPWKRIPLQKFMVLNTAYKEGEPYYGKAYITGTANIFGYMNNLDVTVNAKTERGTWINFPMYGRGDIKEDGFITFVKKADSIPLVVEEKIDFTGVNLNLNFDVRDNALVKIIFNENLGDEISASGSGPINIRLDEFNELSIDGTFRVKNGEYNFAMGPIKKNFYIEEGGTVQWTGDPYDANLNLRTYYLVNANISEVVNDFIDSDRTGLKDEIYCYLDLKESLEKPMITFDIAAPRAPESGKATINRIRGDEDELNRQFFSLLLFRKFQPIKGRNNTANNAALEVVSNQINSILDQVSQDYKLRVKMDADQFTQESNYEFGVSKGFLEDRLIVSGSFGVNQVRAGQEDGALNNFIGDVNLEYKLNTSGTFRVNVFNESNQYSVIQNKNLGLFTQGVGLHYQESFRNIDDFKLIQYGLDVFRPVGKRRFLGQRKNQEAPIPQEYLNQEKGTTEDEEDTNSE